MSRGQVLVQSQAGEVDASELSFIRDAWLGGEITEGRDRSQTEQDPPSCRGPPRGEPSLGDREGPDLSCEVGGGPGGRS